LIFLSYEKGPYREIRAFFVAKMNGYTERSTAGHSSNPQALIGDDSQAIRFKFLRDGIDYNLGRACLHAYPLLKFPSQVFADEVARQLRIALFPFAGMRLHQSQCKGKS